MSLSSVGTPARKQVKSGLVQTELSKPARQVETLPLRRSHGRTSLSTSPNLVQKTKLS